jgi:hypothetical protein
MMSDLVVIAFPAGVSAIPECLKLVDAMLLDGLRKLTEE